MSLPFLLNSTYCFTDGEYDCEMDQEVSSPSGAELISFNSQLCQVPPGGGSASKRSNCSPAARRRQRRRSGPATNSIFFCLLFVLFIDLSGGNMYFSLICLEGAYFFLPFSQQLPHLRLGPLKGTSTNLVCCFPNYRESRTLSGVLC